MFDISSDFQLVRFRTLMAFLLRRWKILLVMNIIAVVMFMCFWAKCSFRSTTAIGHDSHSNVKRHSRYNYTVQKSSISHEALLKRLSSLEDVVYRQLNGKSGLNKFSNTVYLCFSVPHKVEKISVGLL